MGMCSPGLNNNTPHSCILVHLLTIIIGFDFLPFGVGNGDAKLPRASDSSEGLINLSVPIVFYQREENNLYVSSCHSHAHAMVCVLPTGERDIPKSDGTGGGGEFINTEIKISAGHVAHHFMIWLAI